jgi:flagellar hook assembly protein FlgD
MILIVVLLVSFVADAQSSSKESTSNLEVNIHQLTESGKLRVIFVNPSESKVAVTLKNKKGEVVFSETLKDESYKRDFNFSSLESGIYTIEVKSNDKVFDKEFLVTDRVAQKTVSILSSTDIAASKEK